jgi:hypothetical protein
LKVKLQTENENAVLYLFGSSDHINNGSEISDPDMLIAKICK